MALIAVAEPRLLVTVRSPSGTHLVSVPMAARIEDLLPELVRVCEGEVAPAGWRLAPQGEEVFSGEQSLAGVGLFAGAVLLLTPPEPVPVEAGVPPAVQPTLPRIEKMSEVDYVRMLDAAITARRAPSSIVIAVVASHPGAGATTVATLLAVALSELRGDSLVAVDANPESGALSHWLVPDRALPGDVYSSLFSPSVSPPEVGQALVRAGPRLAVLPAPLDPMGARNGDAAAWGRLIEHLRHLHHVVVVDCGAGAMRDPVRAVVAAADMIVLVGETEQPAAATAKLGKPIVLVSNFAPRRARTRRTDSGHQVVSVVADPRAAASLKRRGFAWSKAPSAWQEAVRELAALLVAGA